jgi:outer membrane protein, heavy metal efflux system
MKIQRRSAAAAIIGLFSVYLAATAGAEDLLYPTPAPLQGLLELTATHNDRLRQLEVEIQVLLSEVPAASALDDPVLTLGVNAFPTDSFSFSQEPMTQKQIFIAQRFPWFGTLDPRSRKVALMAARKIETLRASGLELQRAVSETYFKLAFI